MINIRIYRSSEDIVGDDGTRTLLVTSKGVMWEVDSISNKPANTHVQKIIKFQVNRILPEIDNVEISSMVVHLGVDDVTEYTIAQIQRRYTSVYTANVVFTLTPKGA